MTTPEDPKRQASDPDETLPKETNRRHELDAEIVRDLEIDRRTDDVRGGACPTSKPV